MPFSTACNTVLSNFEAGSNYKETSDPAIVITFPLVDDPETSFIAWTTTPWTLPSNLALAVNPEFVYLKIRDEEKGHTYILAESRLAETLKQSYIKKHKVIEKI
jgi:isoleucyl-tRNA synthetase